MTDRRGPSAKTGSRTPAKASPARRSGKIGRRSPGSAQGERSLGESEERFRLLVAGIKDYAIILLDRGGRILTWNDGARIIKGYRADEILGQSMTRFYTPHDVQRGHPAHLLQTAEREERIAEEGWRVRKDGSLFWADVVLTALRDDRGRLRGFAKVTRDLTERRVAETTLRESRERLRAVFDNSPSIMFLKGVDGRYIDCNPPFEALCGRGRDEIIGRTDADLLPAEQAAEFMAHDRGVVNAGTPMRFEETAVHPDGPRVSVVLKFPVRDGEGRVYAVGGIVTDITDRKHAEESLRQLSSRLLQLQDEEQERIARELQGGVAQELDALRSQLLLVKDSGTLLDWKTADALDRSLSLANEATQEIRTLSRLLYPSLLDDAGLVEALRWYGGNFSQRTGVKVVLDVAARFGRLSRDAERGLFRVVQESLTNVHRHSGSTAATVSLMEDTYSIRLEVKDEGQGVPEGILNGLSGTVAISGVGIRGMLERMRLLGGRLEIDCNGGGTTVRAILPASRARRNPSSDAAPSTG